jgi:asparaginyl-tRNA synthetase
VTPSQHCAADLEFFGKFVDKDLLARLDFVLERPFVSAAATPRPIAILNKAPARRGSIPWQWGDNLQSEHERYLTEEHFKCPVTVYNYPRAIKAFYMRQNGEADGRETVAAMDLLVPGIGEIIGGSQREERLDKLRAGMALHHLDEKAYWWYLDLRRYGSVPHAGFGLGFERMLMFVTGVANIRDVIPFARTPGTAEF